jgi:signal transduction histidine kinase
MKISSPYSLLKNIIFKVSLASIVTLIVSGLIIGLGFVNDQKDHLKEGEAAIDIWIDAALSESFEHVYWVFILSFIIITILIYIIVKNALNDMNTISDSVNQIDLNSPDTFNQEFIGPREIQPLLNSLKNSYEKIDRDYKIQKEFIQNASHELNTPIAILRANIESLQNSSAKQELMKDLNLLENVSAQLLRLSQADNFKVRNNESADIIQIINLVIESLSKSDRIVFDTQMNKSEIVGNKEYLYMCFRNLIENALYNSPENSKIQILAEDQNKIVIKNEKANKQLKQQDVEKLFNKFWRFDKNKYPGSGLGLNIVQRIVEAHDANLDVKIDEQYFTISIIFPTKTATNTVH